ncbi:MAG: ABC transporter substrate-binding protein [Deltaproteobacteria bacterium]|nr:ABC transporter substrate-binding protein [Deltaproteobacteria bacterium]MBI3076636.1 ABC transporter substrate-binding protein [Deltaproteobacteria bacterium]
MIRRAFVIASLVGLGLLLLAVPAPAQEITVKMGSATSPTPFDSITPYMAREKGMFKAQGLEVQILDFRGDATVTKALVGGEVDVAVNLGATSAIVSASKGTRIRLHVVPQPITPYTLVARREAARTLKDLVEGRRKSIAVSGIGAISYHIPRVVLEKSGLDPDKATYVGVGSAADRFKSVIAGKVDATIVTASETVELDRYPQLIALAEIPKIVPEIAYTFGVAKQEYLDRNPETAYKLTRGMIEANRYIVTNKAGAVEAGAKIMRRPAEVIARIYDLIDKRLWGVNGDLDREHYLYTVDLLRRVGYLQTPLSYEEFFDRRFVDRVLRELGRM